MTVYIFKSHQIVHSKLLNFSVCYYSKMKLILNIKETEEETVQKTISVVNK
jgi:hypothetical protein